MSEEDLQAELAHYGKKGMKWGTRRAAGPLTPTPKQSVGQTIAKNMTIQRQKLHQRNATGAITKPIRSLDNKITGGKYKAINQRRVGELERSKERIAAGELVARTILFGAVYTKTN
jgi:hypothetical protein